MRAQHGYAHGSTLVLAVAALALSGCTVTRQVADSEFRPPQAGYRVIVMQPDISVGLLTAGGNVEPREDWTNQAREHVLSALSAQQSRRGGNITIAMTREQAGGDADQVAELVWLHNAVGQSIRAHKYYGPLLPTKKEVFDWTLGEAAVAYGKATNYDYALFLHAQDSFSSAGRVALQAFGAIGCGLGICVIASGGMQIAFVSLVDLKTGQVVWFNSLADETGDIRTAEGAKRMVDLLLDEMEAGKPPKPAVKAKT